MRIGVPREHGSGERRVALTPRVAGPLVADGHDVLLEAGAGEAAGFPDATYRDLGIEIVQSPVETVGAADAVLRVGTPAVDEVDMSRPGGVLIGPLAPLSDAALVGRLAERAVTGLAIEAVPRISVAQTMDALSSQATAAGYASVLLAASLSPRFFPMLTTAAGTIRPARVLILGCGVAGLQALATARRLGAVGSAYDLRPEVREQVESLGGRFVGGPVEDQASASGYATEVDAATQRGQIEALAEHVTSADVVIATAAVPGRSAPLLIDRQVVEEMPGGAVIVDVAAPTGGNCELTRPDRVVEHAGVTIVGPTDLPSRVASDASQMYARNVVALLDRMLTDGAIRVDLDDPVIGGCCITHDGEVVHAGSRKLLGVGLPPVETGAGGGRS